MDRNSEVLNQYDFKIYNISRARGGFLIDTDSGYKLVKKTDNNIGKILFEHSIKEHLYSLGNEMVDIIICNKDGNIITYDKDETPYIIKKWFQAEPCEFTDLYHIKLAAMNLGLLHSNLSNIKIKDVDRFDSTLYNTQYLIGENIINQFEKRNKELRRVRTYIKNKKQKNMFEITYYKNFEIFYKKAIEAQRRLCESSYYELYKKSIENLEICHGNYAYHNVLLDKSAINANNINQYENIYLKAADLNESMPLYMATTNFDKAYYGVQIADLYYFLRKVMEKNNWDLIYASELINSYDNQKKISKDEFELLYIMLLYPEKFWKVTNNYYNNKKSWVSNINIQKLNMICEQEEKKEQFLNVLEEYCN